MNAPSSAAAESAKSPMYDSANTRDFCGKGLHYDWRAIVAAAEASNLDAELAELDAAATLS